MIKWIDDPNVDVSSKRVLCRVDFNVPLTDDGEIADESRILSALPTIQHLLKENARIVLASHLGRPKGKPRSGLSLEPVALRLSQLLKQDVVFVEDCVGDGVSHLVSEMKDGSVLLLENLRFHSGEEKNDEKFSKRLAKHIDIYVDDAFGAVHRAHASIEGVTHFIEEKYGGLLLKQEVNALEQLIRRREKPFVALLGGSKVSDKIALVTQLLSRVDKLLIGGAMAYTFLKAKNIEVGKSKVEEDKLKKAAQILEKAKLANVDIVLPVDHISVADFSKEAQIVETSESIPEANFGIDIGLKTRRIFEDVIKRGQTLFWNGPMGVFEWESGAAGTKAVTAAVCASSAYSVVGGGDSVLALKTFGLKEDVSFVSTGGGASMAFLEGASMPGLKALNY